MMGCSSVSVSMTAQAGTMTWPAAISPGTTLLGLFLSKTQALGLLSYRTAAVGSHVCRDVLGDATQKHPQSVFLKLDACISNRILT